MVSPGLAMARALLISGRPPGPTRIEVWADRAAVKLAALKKAAVKPAWKQAIARCFIVKQRSRVERGPARMGPCHGIDA